MKQASQQWLQCQRMLQLQQQMPKHKPEQPELQGLLGMHNQAYVHVQAVAELTPEEGFLFLW